MQESTLSPIDKKRLENALQILSDNNIRFTVAETVRRTGENKGNVSNFLSGKKPMTERFYKKFLEVFRIDEKEIKGELNDKMSFVIEKLINHQATLNVLRVVAEGISASQKGMEPALVSSQILQAIDVESDRLFDLFSKKGKF